MTDDIFKVPDVRSARPKSELALWPGRLGRRGPHNPMDAYALIHAAAIAGDRAPKNPELNGGSSTVRKLIDLGKIRVEIYAHNWRVFELIDGPDSGARTAEDPKGGGPHRVTEMSVKGETPDV